MNPFLSRNRCSRKLPLKSCKKCGIYSRKCRKITSRTKKSRCSNSLIVDPPRTGLSKKLIKTLLEVKPETFVYVSCNPATLAKDLVLLSEAYDVRVIQPVDMMPQTPRWEGVTKLVLRKNK